MLSHKIIFTAVISCLPLCINGQLSGTVGPLTSASKKAATKVCNILNYGAKAGTTTDVGPPIASAWAACASGGLVYIPPGTYQMATWVDLKHGSKIAIQLDGIIQRTGTAGGTMFAFTSVSDFEFFSGTSKGAIQGFGYEFISKGTYGPRLLRFTTCSDFSLHGIALVDSPSYYVSILGATNVEVYNMISRGITIGATDGYDVSGTNIWM
jgi:rhamnogalacturonan hydrolase